VSPSWTVRGDKKNGGRTTDTFDDSLQHPSDTFELVGSAERGLFDAAGYVFDLPTHQNLHDTDGVRRERRHGVKRWKVWARELVDKQMGGGRRGGRRKRKGRKGNYRREGEEERTSS